LVARRPSKSGPILHAPEVISVNPGKLHRTRMRLHRFGRVRPRGVVDPTRRVDDALPYRGGNAGSSDGEPTQKVRVVNPHAGKWVGDGRHVGSAPRASDDVLDQELISGARLVEAGAAAGDDHRVAILGGTAAKLLGIEA
jgi:hypothetical protein